MTSQSADTDWATYDLPLGDRAEPDAPAPLPPASESDETILLHNGAWFCSLRWLAIAALAGLALLGWATASGLSLPGFYLTPGWPLCVAGILALLNLAYLALARAAARIGQRGRLALRILWAQILLDLAALTVVVHYLGSLETYAPFMYLFHIVLACIFLPYAQSLLVTLSAMGMYLVCLVIERTATVSASSVLVESFLHDRNALPIAVEACYFGSVAFISVTVWYLASRLANALRQRDEELAAINQRLVAATEERARYMLSTTHQLKAPFAAIHANTQLLLGGYCGPIPPEAVTVIEHIATRCEMLSRGIKAMLQLANLRSSAQRPPPAVEVDMPALIRSCLAAVKPQASKRGIVLDEDLQPATAQVVQDHAVMIIDNLLSNAINYSHDGQHVAVSSRAKPEGGASVVVRDSGIGIPPDKLPRIFDDYFRTNQAVKHNNASTGLGLAIVRQTALAGKIGVRVESALGRGTLFSLSFPSSPGEPDKPK